MNRDYLSTAEVSERDLNQFSGTETTVQLLKLTEDTRKWLLWGASVEHLEERHQEN